MEELFDQNELLILLRKKENQAFRYLYSRYFVALKSLADQYIRNSGEAEDLVQDVFFSLLKSDYTFQNMRELQYFLYSSLKNRCISHLRKQKIREKFSREMISTLSESDHYWEKVLEEDVYARLMAAIDTLSSKCKMVMLLTLDGLKASEIAEKMNISVDTVKEHKKTGKKKLASRLKDGEMLCLIGLLWL